MKLILALLIALPLTAQAYDPMDPFGKRKANAEWYKKKYANYDHSDYEEHKQKLQGHIDYAVERQREADEIIQRNKLDVPHFLMQACREYVIEETLLEHGYMKTSAFTQKYKDCLRDAGVANGVH